MLINVAEDEEYRIAVVEDDVLEELYLERTRAERHVGDIYLGRVQNVEPSIQAAFIEIGTEKNGFLHISDIRPDVHDIPPVKTPSQRPPKNDERKISSLLKKGDPVLVQVTREGIDAKGPSVTTYVSLPGKYLVMMPGLSHYGVSRKIQDQESRKRLKSILGSIDLPKRAGFIIRTAGLGRTKRDLQRDLRYLQRLWDALCKKLAAAKAPALLYQESDLIIRCMRDLFTSDTDDIVVDSEDVCNHIREFLAIVSPSYQDRVKLHRAKAPLFTKFKVEQAVEQVYSRKVMLPHGGSIVIEQAEALVAIDVNSGKFTDGSDAEMTAYRTNMEAAPEIARQLRLRDLGGVIVMDFIDMTQEKHRRDVEHELFQAMRRDRARTKILRTSQFGIIQMTRQRMRTSVARAAFTACPSCRGSGLVRSRESIMIDLMRKIRSHISQNEFHALECVLHPDVALYVLNEKRRSLIELEKLWKRNIIIKTDSNMDFQEMRIFGLQGKTSVKL
ncbi:MAG: Rne/Rng family ribonuclease [Planctomycetota bacterium]